MIVLRIVLYLAASLTIASASAMAPADAPDAPPVGARVLVSIGTGEAFLGKLVRADNDQVVIDHATLGRLQMPRSQVTAIALQPEAPATPAPPTPPSTTGTTPPPSTPPATPPPPAVTIAPPPPPEPAPDPDSFWDGWKHSIELGLNDAEGNSESLSVHGGFKTVRETSTMVTTFDGSYNYASSGGEKTTDRGELNLRNDWRISPPWRIYALGKVEYDTFQDWDWRTSLFGGLGYEFIKSDNTLLLGRVGAGASKEFGGSKNRIEPELDLGLDWEHKFDERQKIFATFDYYPSLHRFTDYRTSLKAGYEILVDPKSNLSFKVGVDDQYNSNPGDDKKKNDILYFAALLFSF